MLSIRTQDRMALIPYTRPIEIINNTIWLYVNVESDEIKLGTYATKERALEVLDEIQEIISNQYNELLNSNLYSGSDAGSPFNGNKVYEMPKEWLNE